MRIASTPCVGAALEARLRWQQSACQRATGTSKVELRSRHQGESLKVALAIQHAGGGRRSRLAPSQADGARYDIDLPSNMQRYNVIYIPGCALVEPGQVEGRVLVPSHDDDAR